MKLEDNSIKQIRMEFANRGIEKTPDEIKEIIKLADQVIESINKMPYEAFIKYVNIMEAKDSYWKGIASIYRAARE